MGKKQENAVKSVQKPAGAPKVELKSVEGRDCQVGPAGKHAEFDEVFGTTDGDFIGLLMDQLLNLVPMNEPNMAQLNGLIAAVAGINPRDEIEGMLAVQMVATHFAASQSTKNALASQMRDDRNLHFKHAGQLMRTFTQQMEALNKYRGKGRQKVTVEHVTVNDGGQAIVGEARVSNEG